MSQASEELFTIQEQMEAEMTGQGLTRYWRNVDPSVAEGDESSTSYGLTVLKRVINPVAARIEEVVAEADSGKPGRRSTAIKYLRGTSADLIAYLTVKVLLDSVSRRGDGVLAAEVDEAAAVHLGPACRLKHISPMRCRL